ncbi:MAG TPA: glycosyltransferase family 39 protein [Candidatus Binataceae bacterium]|nr:glycosyltransferase family 39 protein [Candidatus Binataceae bacterium]
MESAADPNRACTGAGATACAAARPLAGALDGSTVEIFGRAVPWRAAVAAVLGLAAVMFFARLGARALWSSEFRWAEIAREMHLTGRYFWPTINGKVYYDKPLGSYWLVLGAAWLTGGVDETAARLPCAIAGLLAVWLLILIARRLYDQRSALLAGVVLATSFSFVFFARHASADVETATGELAALALFLRNEERQDGWWVVGLWLVMAATSLTKGLLGFVLPLMVIGLYSALANGWAELWRRVARGAIPDRIGWLIERNRWLFNWKSIPAIALGGAIYYVPFAISAASTGSEKGLEMVYRENVVRFFHPFDHRGPIYLYVYVIFALMMPWSAFLPAALAEAHRRGGPSEVSPRSNRFALVYFWATFIFFTLSGSRRSYYLLPILPAAALLVGQTLTTSLDALSPLGRRLLRVGYAVIAVGVIGAFVVLLPPAWILPGRLAALPPAPDRVLYAACWIIALGAVLYAIRRFDSRRAAASTATVAVVFLGYLYIFAMPAADQWRGERSFAEAIRRQMGTATSGVVLYRSEGPIFYLGLPHPLPYYDDAARLRRDALEGNVRWVIVRRRDLATFESALRLAASVAAREKAFPFEPHKHTLNKEVLVVLQAPEKPGSVK